MTNKKRTTELYVYFIRCGRYVKIGKSVDPECRLVQLGQGHPHMRIIGVIKIDNAGEEKMLHRRFAEHHAQGEWFRFHRDIKEYVETYAAENYIQKSLEEMAERLKDWGLEHLTPKERKAFYRECRELELESRREEEREIEAEKRFRRAWRDAAGNYR